VNKSGFECKALSETDPFRYGCTSTPSPHTADCLLLTDVHLYLQRAFEQNKIVLSLLCGAVQLKWVC